MTSFNLQKLYPKYNTIFITNRMEKLKYYSVFSLYLKKQKYKSS